MKAGRVKEAKVWGSEAMRERDGREESGVLRGEKRGKVYWNWERNVMGGGRGFGREWVMKVRDGGGEEGTRGE